MRTSLVLGIGLIAALSTAPARAQRGGAPPALTPFTAPMAATPGSTTVVAFHVAGAKAAPGFWATFPCEAEPLDSSQPTIARFRLGVPANAPVGVGAVRFITAAGVSSPRLFMVDDIPTTEAADNHTSPRDAQPLTLPAAVEADAVALAAHHYRFAARAGERVAFEVVAHRLGSRMDAVVRVLDAAGRELAYADDTPGLGADPRFAHTFAAAGDYVVEVRDADYQGGQDRRYRLRVGDFPAVTTAFPAGGRRGADATFTFENAGGERLGPVTVRLPNDSPRANVPLKFPGGRSSSWVPVLVGDAEDFRATAPAGSIAVAATPPLPAFISGRFTKPGQRDVYGLDASKGRTLAVRAHTRAIQSPASVFLQLLKPDGGKVAESKPTEGKTAEAKPLDADDGALTFDVPSNGAYYLAVTELAGAAGPAHTYRLGVEQKPAAGFALTVDTDKVDAPAGGTLRVKVKAARRNYDGPITLALGGGDAAGFEVKAGAIAKGKAEADLEFTIPPDAPTSRPLLLAITGTAKIDGADRTETASTAPALRTLWPRIAHPPAELDGQIALGVTTAEKRATTKPAATR
jgi:hypothetical protein